MQPLRLRVPAEVRTKIDHVAEREGRTRSDIVRRAIRRELQRCEEVHDD